MSSPASAPAAPAAGAALTERLRDLRDALLTGLVERDVAIRLALIGALAGEHLLLLGPPGTAKSLIARRLRHAFADATYFERLLTRFTVPEELFGPLSIKGLEEDRYERLTSSYLPTASIAFLDEIFKANSAILNALLTLLNEREFDNGTQRVRTPLIGVIGASNELPEGEELGALFDRFLLRLHVGPVSNEGFVSLLQLRGEAEPVVHDELRLTAADLKWVREHAPAVEVPDDVQAMLIALRDWCAAEGVAVSDRRWRKIVKLLQVSALTNGRQAVSVWDCWLLQHCTWDTPEDRAKVYGWYAERVGASKAMDPSRLTKVVVAWEGQLVRDQEDRSQRRDEEGRLLFEDGEGKATVAARGPVQELREDEPLFLAPTLCSRHQGYNFDNYRIKDRTNGRKGYTSRDLNDLYVRDVRGSELSFSHWPERAEYLTNPNNWLAEEEDFQPLMEPTRHKSVYVDGCLRDVAALHDDVVAYEQSLAAHLEGMSHDIRSHLWVTADFAEPARASLEGTQRTVAELLRRVQMLRKGIELLPRDEPPTTKVVRRKAGGA
jgi:MoxR-like ATPase